MNFQKHRSIRICRVVAKQILESIRREAFRVHNKFPSQVTISCQTGIPDLYVQEPLKLLPAAGVTKSRPDRSNFLNHRTSSTKGHLLLILENKLRSLEIVGAMELLEGLVTALSAQKRPAENLYKLGKFSSGLRHLSQQGQGSKRFDANKTFHLAPVATVGNSLFTNLLFSRYQDYNLPYIPTISMQLILKKRNWTKRCSQPALQDREVIQDFSLDGCQQKDLRTNTGKELRNRYLLVE